MNAHKTVVSLLLAGLLLMGGTVGSRSQEKDAPVIKSRRLDEPIAPSPTSGPAPARVTAPSNPTLRIGIGPIMIDGKKRVETLATVFSEVGADVARNYPWLAEWGKMQRWSTRSPIKFDELDRFVGSFQAAGFTDIMICLRSNCKWASREYDKKRSPNPTPKPEFQEAYAGWITAIVERYDGDGIQDMRGLLRPVRLYEIGAQFSREEPAPVDDYLEMLQVAYGAAHKAFPEVQVAHAGFVTTGVFDHRPGPDEYEAAFADSRLVYHKLPAVQAVLDAHEFFDLVNLHSLGEPREIDAMVTWIRHELDQRDIEKPIVIGETTPSPFITHGSATSCELPPEEMGVIVAPATEDDRCRLALYFANLIGGDEYSELWAHRYAAADMVKKVVLAADHDLMLINTASAEDLSWQKKRSFQAATGNAPWAGMVDLSRKGRRPGFFALNQLTQRLRGYDDVRRLQVDDAAVAIYQITSGDATSWVAWLEPETLPLPGDPSPRIEIDLPVTMSTVMIERMISKDGQIHPTRNAVIPIKGILPVVVTPYPVYVYSRF